MNIKIKIPTSLNEITLRQYKKFIKIQDNVESQRFINAKMIEIFCGVDLKKVMLLQLSDAEDISNKIAKLFDQKPALIKTFKLNKKEYGFHPELDELTLGEYIDLDNHIGDWDNIEKAMNVLYRPILVKSKERYAIEEYIVGTEENLLDMPLDAVLSSIFFLWNLGIELSKTILNSLEEGQEREALTQFLNSQESGDGINQFMGSLTEILQDLKISLN